MLPLPNDLNHFEICATFDLVKKTAKSGLHNDPID